MSRYLTCVAIALAWLSLPASASAQNYCFAGPNCPQAYCWQCDIDAGTGFGTCQSEPETLLRCACHELNRHCRFSGPPQCVYGTCRDVDGTGPCIWNGPPVRSSRSERPLAPESGRPSTSDAGADVGSRHVSG
jgi:hypothetical protein